MSLTLRKLALLMALLVAVSFTQAAPAAAQAVITNGTVTLGVNAHGQLNVPGPESPIVRTPVVGLRYNANGWEALSHHSPCEGWGVAIANIGVTGWANQCFDGPGEGGPVNGLRFQDFTFTGDSATSRVFLPNPFNAGHDLLEVTHNWVPSAWPTLYQGNVTIRNANGGFLGNVGATIGDIRYRRVMDWDVEPTASEDFVSIGGIDGGVQTPAYLLFSGDNGFEVPDPLRFENGAPVDVFAAIQQSFGVANPVPCGFTRNFTNCGRFLDPDPIVVDHGAMFDFAFPALAPGAAHEFAIFYGAAASREEAEMALYMVGAEVYSLANCRPLEPGFGGYAGCDLTTGAPVTFIFAAAGVGGAPVFGDISGVVYQDVNGNGVYDAGVDTPLAGVTVMVLGTDLNGNAVTRTTISQADGSYVFMAMPRGSYSVSSSTLAGALVRSTASPLTADVAGTFPYVMDVNFGYVPAAAVSGTVFNDTNNNGALDSTDAPMAGVTITLTGPGGARTTTSGANGAYSFTGLLPGTYTASAPATVGNQPLVTPSPVSLTLGAGAQGVANFGYVTLVTVSGTVYTDLNSNGVFNAGSDTPLAGVTITLTGPGGARTATTGANGTYSFAGLLPGTYTAASPATVGGLPLLTPSPLTLTLAGGQQGVANFGYAAPAAISGTAFTDVNGNGLYNAGTDTPLPGVMLTLTGPGGTRTVTTDAGGAYTFGNLLPGTYTVAAPATAGGQLLSTPSPVTLTLVAAQLGIASFGYVVPAGVSGTVYTDVNANGTFDSGTDTPLTGVMITLNGPGGARTATTGANGTYSFTGLFPGTYTVTAPATAGGQPLVTPSPVTLTLGGGQQGAASFGYRKPVTTPTGSISGGVYAEPKHRHGKAGLDTPLAGVTITLTGPGGTRLTATTGADGNYSFTGLAAGRYTVSAPRKFNGEPLITASPVAVNLATGQQRVVDFGYKQPPLAKIHGVVFVDVKDDREFSEGKDTRLAGITVTLSGPDGTRTVTTDADGKYAFADLLPGRYTVSVPATFNGQPTVTQNPVTMTVHGGHHRVDFGYKKAPVPDCRPNDKSCKGKDRR